MIDYKKKYDEDFNKGKMSLLGNPAALNTENSQSIRLQNEKDEVFGSENEANLLL